MIVPSLGVLAAYGVGATPTSHWVALGLYGLDLRNEGSGNLGATNAFRVLGPGVAVPILLVDIFKGWLPAFAFPLLLGLGEGWALAFGAAAVLGHSFSFWVGFRGGKGVATATGVFLAVAPWALLLAFTVWVAVVATTRLVSLASVLAAATLAVVVHWTPHSGGEILPFFTLGVALFVFWTHRGNLARLARGEEPRLGAPKGGGG